MKAFRCGAINSRLSELHVRNYLLLGRTSALRCHATISKGQQLQLRQRPKMDKASAYNRWTKEALIRRIQELEADKNSTAGDAASPALLAPSELLETPLDASVNGARTLKPNKKKTDKKIDPSKYATRLIALKLAYVGKNYGGFEFQLSATLPTIEEELWKALVKSCLIFPENPEEVKWEEWEYSKCGRTDRGVSAFGQVIGVRVRSNRPLPKKKETAEVVVEESTNGGAVREGGSAATEAAPEEEIEEEKPFDDFKDEVQYCKILNRLLPPDIRILAWCPATPEQFSARHDCRERQYRYFFTQPAYSPVPSSLENPKSTPKVKDGWLDIDAMRQAAKKFEGVHDFRNFCKIDPSKLITNFERNIFECDIVEVKGAEASLPYLDQDEFRAQQAGAGVMAGEKGPKVYYFHVRGSAFLWHQIRCMVAVIFMVGQGLEEPAIVDQLLDYRNLPRRPNYVLASEFPLVLWDCVFPKEGDLERKDAMDWVYLGEENPMNKHGPFGLVDHMWEFWRERKLDEILSSQLLNLVTDLVDSSKRRDSRAPPFLPLTQRMFEGANRERLVGKYQPVLKKSRLPAPEETYDKEARRKGYENANAWREARAKKSKGDEEDTAAGEEGAPS
ncbi:pseudouridine synthase [Xylariales sp. PMI_506]|nr:pseudouridine synthase [Xylariales sp. PMI_506]